MVLFDELLKSDLDSGWQDKIDQASLRYFLMKQRAASNTNGGWSHEFWSACIVLLKEARHAIGQDLVTLGALVGSHSLDRLMDLHMVAIEGGLNQIEEQITSRHGRRPFR